MRTNADGLAYRDIDGTRVLATRGSPVYGEPTADGWRAWSVRRSKLGGMLDREMAIHLTNESRVLYLGASSGTTVSHLADVVEVVYAVEFAPRPMADLLDVAAVRKNVIPLLKDARQPESYAHVVESDIDLVVQDVATRNQAGVALANRHFLRPGGQLALAIKARSEDVTASPDETYEIALETLEVGYDIEATERLDPTHRDHLGIVARRRPDDERTEAL